MKRKQFELLKDLPGCPTGRIFKEAVNNSYYNLMTDQEFIDNEYQSYSIMDIFVENNSEWFKEIKDGEEKI